MKSFGKKLVAGLAMIASVFLMTGCGNGNSSGTESGPTGVYSAFGTSVACGQVSYGQVINATAQTVYGLNLSMQIYTDSSGTQIGSMCGTMQVSGTVYAGSCQILPGTYTLGLLTTGGVVSNSIQSSYGYGIVSMNFQAVPSGGYVSGNAYSISMQTYMQSGGASQILGGGGGMVVNSMAPGQATYGTTYGTSTLPCNDYQGESM